jgi:hypothetical protein
MRTLDTLRQWTANGLITVSAGAMLLAMKVMPGDMGFGEELMQASMSGDFEQVDMFDEFDIGANEEIGIEEWVDLAEIYPESEPLDPDDHKVEDPRDD